MKQTKTKPSKPLIPIQWPKGVFSIAELQAMNPNVVNITLRYRINRDLKSGKTVVIGKNPLKMGRPTLVFASSNVSTKKLDEAKKNGIVLFTEFEKRTTCSVIVADYTQPNGADSTLRVPTDVQHQPIATNVIDLTSKNNSVAQHDMKSVLVQDK